MYTRHILSFVSGLVFALGLGVAGMTQPAKVLAFLDITGAWNPALAFVVGGAILVYAVMYRLALGRGSAILGGPLQIPTRRDIDVRLLAGAALFGVGWGLSGFCPGPALTALASGNAAIVGFVVAMTAGMYAKDGLDACLATRTPGAGAGLHTGRMEPLA